MVKIDENSFVVIDKSRRRSEWTDGPANCPVASYPAGFLASSRQALVAAQSRSNEYEADSLGCKLAAMACYDPKIGSKVFLKMHQASIGQRTNGLMSSHPASKERYETLQELSSIQSSIQYSYCEVLKKRVRRALSVASSGNE